MSDHVTTQKSNGRLFFPVRIWAKAAALRLHRNLGCAYLHYGRITLGRLSSLTFEKR